METATMPTPFEVTIKLTDEQFWQLCQNNRDLRFERSASGDLIISPLLVVRLATVISIYLINCKDGVVKIT
jgi:Uma2 family endonuclease